MLIVVQRHYNGNPDRSGTQEPVEAISEEMGVDELDLIGSHRCGQFVGPDRIDLR